MLLFEERSKSQLLLISLKLILVLLALLAVVVCMDPSEYKPEDPPQKIDPPEAPHMLLPEADDEYRCMNTCWVSFDWSYVEGAEGYEIQISADSTFANAFPYPAYGSSALHELIFYAPRITYYCRVHAHSSAWTWYTAWSETRRFHLLPVTGDTIYPTN